MDERQYQQLFAELSEYEAVYGVSMKLENEPASPMQIVKAHMIIEEECTYMRDYEWDEKGRIKELSFHHISNT